MQQSSRSTSTDSSNTKN